MKILFQSLLLVFMLNIPSVFASHSFGGLDMCAVYPEVMPPGLASDLLPDTGSHGARLMETYCTQCHALPGPGRHTAEEWPQVLERMFVLMDVADRFGGLLGNVKTPSLIERDQLSNYLVLHSLKAMMVKPQGVGAAAFENHCAGCHALPNLAQYQHLDQSSLIKRMQRNMEVMKYAPPTTDAMMQIQLYMQNNVNAVDAENGSSDNSLMPGQDSGSAHLPEREFSYGSWLALAPFFLLVFVGLFRWWNNHQRLKYSA